MTKAEAAALGYTLERIRVPDGRARTRDRYFWLTPKGRRLGPFVEETEALAWLWKGLREWADKPEQTPS